MRKKNKQQQNKKAIWKGSISFGLVNVPVQLFSAREQGDLHFTMLDPSNLSPIGYRYYNKISGEEIERSETVKAYKYKPDLYVIMSEADFKKANPKATQTIDIENFVYLNEIDPVFFKRAYYLVPTKSGEKGYQILCEALTKTKKVAIAKIVLHTKQHLAAIIPRGHYLLLELFYFGDEVKEFHELEQVKFTSDTPRLKQEQQMAEKLIEEMSTKWKPDMYKDTYRTDLMKHIQAKVRAGKATQIIEEHVEQDKNGAEVVDLLPLLRKSLKKTKPKKSIKSRKKLTS